VKCDVLLLDGTNLAHRAWYGGKGDEVQAYGILSGMIGRAVAWHGPRLAAVALDSPDLWRRRLYPAYKANRREKDPRCTAWINTLQDGMLLGGLRTVVAKEWEADDVLATLVTQAEKKEYVTHVLTSDRDAYALVTPFTSVTKFDPNPANPSGYRVVDWNGVQRELNLWPEQVCDLKALAGDPSDNVPGVPGIGPKRATALLQQHGALENVWEHLTSPPVRGDLKEAITLGMLAYDLVKLNREAPVSALVDACPVNWR
jgi:5'-3' exonuclease